MYSWRRIKKDILHHFNLPRLDLLVWALVRKLASTYYRKLDVMLVDTGRYRELPAWRKDFKKEWKRAARVAINDSPENQDRYRPDLHRFVCTCPYFATSRFLLCKHLVQLFCPVPPTFYLEVTRNRSTPFWSHPSLIPLDEANMISPNARSDDGPPPNSRTRTITLADLADDDDADENLVDTGAENRGKTFCETFEDQISRLQDFLEGCKYQIQFRDQRMMDTFQRDAAPLLRLAESCSRKERGAGIPVTWEKSAVSAMWYRPRPRRNEDVDT